MFVQRVRRPHCSRPQARPPARGSRLVCACCHVSSKAIDLEYARDTCMQQTSRTGYYILYHVQRVGAEDKAEYSKAGGTSCPTRDCANSWPMSCCRLTSSSRLACRTPSSTCAPVYLLDLQGAHSRALHALVSRHLVAWGSLEAAHGMRRGTGCSWVHCFTSLHGICLGTQQEGPLLFHPGIPPAPVAERGPC